MDIKERLKLVRKYAGMGQTKFEIYTGIATGYFSRVKGSIGSDTINKILDKFPDIDANWLITGEGKMLKASSASTSVSNNYEGQFEGGQFSTQIGDNNTIGNHNAIGSNIIENRDKEIVKLKKENEALKQENTILKTQVEEKERFIKMLLDK